MANIIVMIWLERIDTLRCLDLRRERDSMPSTSATLATAVRQLAVLH